MKTIADVDVSGKRVLVRVDFNVPLTEAGEITDDGRIVEALPTLVHAKNAGAKLIVASHLGRPKGKPVAAFSLKPAARRLSELLNHPVRMAPDCIGSEVTAMTDQMKPGDVILLENLRFHPEEEKNDDAFARTLAGLCDVYVNDAFAVCHRVNASVAAITGHAPVCAAGFLLDRELGYFKKAFAEPRRPLAAIVGGAKVSSKLSALRFMLEKVDTLIIGGAMANTFLKQAGYEVGRSKVEDDLLSAAAEVMEKAAKKGVKLYLPVDAVVAEAMTADAHPRVVPVREIPADRMMLDIGPATVLLFTEALQDSKTIVWNGPMGVFEVDAFSRGTMALAERVAGSHALTIVGGGDTDSAVHKAGVGDRIGYISTGGGAFLALLEGKALPAVQALEAAQARLFSHQS